MDGYQLFVSNSSTIPPNGDLCHKDDQGKPYPDITQTIPCNQHGQYVIYYDEKGSDEGSLIHEAVVELCYVSIIGRSCFIVFSVSLFFNKQMH